MYRDQVELFGQEYADRVIEKLRNAKGPERWEIIVVSPQDPDIKNLNMQENILMMVLFSF